MRGINLAELETAVNAAAVGLPKTTGKKMFGCHALWADGNVFALVWKHGRIGVKLPEPKAFDELIAQKGAAPWMAGPMTMSHWVLVPPTMHLKPAELKKWVARAHAQCIALPAKPAKKPAESAAKKPGAGKPTKSPARRTPAGRKGA